MPGPRACRRRDDAESLGQSRRGLVLARGNPAGRRTTVDDETGTPRPNADEPRSYVHRVAAAQTESVEVHRRDTDAERKVCAVGAQQRPHVPADLDVHRVREHAVNGTYASRVDVERVPHRQGLHLATAAQEIAVMKFLEFDTQPKMPPWALIISSPTRWNSGKYDATQSLSTTHS